MTEGHLVDGNLGDTLDGLERDEKRVLIHDGKILAQQINNTSSSNSNINNNNTSTGCMQNSAPSLLAVTGLTNLAGTDSLSLSLSLSPALSLSLSPLSLSLPLYLAQ